jgi:hypothetical protein
MLQRAASIRLVSRWAPIAADAGVAAGNLI